MIEKGSYLKRYLNQYSKKPKVENFQTSNYSILYMGDLLAEPQILYGFFICTKPVDSFSEI